MISRADTGCVTLEIGTHKLHVEVARSEAARQRGLSGRDALPDGHGMLFVFTGHGYRSMWMKDTLIPLSVAFIDDDGIIINIAQMEPESEDAHYSLRPARYALEVPRGWFERHGIEAGSRVEGLALTDSAELPPGTN